mmetsp:Transcript_15390/g.25197  ORF Transcript_15390/g.25197 Transcript_15390/m.25197 type:complete len:130 (-) Transcript_15390:552-941(-)
MPATYAEFWGGPAHYGYVYYDGALDLATMFEYTQNFTVFGSDVPCLADCYFGGDGCTYLENWLPFAGAISKEQYCSQKWSKIDYAYGALRVCAAKKRLPIPLMVPQKRHTWNTIKPIRIQATLVLMRFG